jgi:O-antigen/teichoic acid export membrane protein
LGKFRKILDKLDIDRAVIFGLLSKVWSVASGLLAAVIIVNKFTPELQGYYYTFMNLIALQVFIELGFGVVIIPFASHEWFKLGLNKDGDIVGDQESLSRLISLAHITFKWYLIGSLIIIAGLGGGGYIFFSQSNNPGIDWVLPWLTLSLFTGLSICLVPIWSLLEGCNQVGSLYTYRFFQGLFRGLSIFVAILLGAKLWTASISYLVVLITAIIFLRAYYWKFFKTLLFSRPSSSNIRWRADILPMQWRIALSWISAYFAFSLFTPVLFRYHGSVVAGQMGITWSFVAALGPISSCWLYPRVPQFGMLIARKEYDELDRLFWRITKIVVGITILGAAVIWSMIVILNRMNHPLAERFLPPLATGIFLLTQVLMSISIPFSSYLRAHKKEPLLVLSVITGVLTGLFTLVLGKYYSVIGIAIGYLCINVILIPFVIVIWYRCKVAWHNEAYA